MSVNERVIQLQNERNLISVTADGAQVLSWKVKTTTETWRELLYQGSSLKRTGIPLLFPHFGKSERYRMHGFGRSSAWKVVAAERDAVKMSLAGRDLQADILKEYPYDFVAEVEIDIDSKGFSYVLNVKNMGNMNLPLMPGLHPYWSIKHEKKQGLKIVELNEFEASEINWTESPPDNVYKFPAKCEVILPNGKVGIEDLSPEKKIMKLVVWSQTPKRDPDFDFVCVEPTCGEHYEIDKSPILVAAGESWQMKMGFVFFEQ